jgi:hypothetical protein
LSKRLNERKDKITFMTATQVFAAVLALLATSTAFTVSGALRSVLPASLAFSSSHAQQQQQCSSPLTMQASSTAAEAPAAAAETSAYEKRKEDLKKALAREYQSFFSPFELEFYRKVSLCCLRIMLCCSLNLLSCSAFSDSRCTW